MRCSANPPMFDILTRKWQVGAALDGVEERVGAGGVDKWMHLEGARLIMVGVLMPTQHLGSTHP